jgi:hypothetical protein
VWRRDAATTAAETAALHSSCNKTMAGIRNHLPGYPAFVLSPVSG